MCHAACKRQPAFARGAPPGPGYRTESIDGSCFR
jgi:hypothetical protein